MLLDALDFNDLIDFTDLAVCDPVDTADELPILPPGEFGADLDIPPVAVDARDIALMPVKGVLAPTTGAGGGGIPFSTDPPPPGGFGGIPPPPLLSGVTG